MDCKWRSNQGPRNRCHPYVTRGDKSHVSSFFSVKLRDSQTMWLSCKIEAHSIAAATKHDSPYLIQSTKKVCILTDSKPCIQAHEKLCRGEFSASPSVSTFLSVLSRYEASFRHTSGAAILLSDFASRNATACEIQTCQVCSFTLEAGTLMFVPFPFKISSRLTSVSPLPADPLGWVSSLSAQIYAAHMLTSSRVQDLPKDEPASRTSNAI